MSLPLVSIIIPAYNAERYIGQALESLFSQTLQDYEILICDDGSTDNTLQVCRSYNDPRIHIYQNEVNIGYLKTMNRLLGIGRERGKYVMVQDADDMSARDRIERQLKAFSDHPEAGLVFTSGFFFMEDGRKLIHPKKDDCSLSLASEDIGIPASMMVRSDILQGLSGFNEYFDRLTSMDRYFIMEMLSSHAGYLINDHLYFARITPGSNHRSLSRNLRKLVIHDVYRYLWKQRLKTGTDLLKEQNFEALRQLEEAYLADKKRLARSLLDYAVSAVDAGQFRSYLKIALKVFQHDPLNTKQYRTLIYCLRTMMGKRKRNMKVVYGGADITFEPL